MTAFLRYTEITSKKRREESDMKEKENACTTSTGTQTLTGLLYLAALALPLFQLLIGG